MDVARARLVFVMVVFALAFAGISLRVLNLGLEGVEFPVDVPDTEQPTMVDALLGKDDAVPDEEVKASVDEALTAARPLRADIVDRNGVVLAASVQTQSLYADAKVVRQSGVPAVVKALCGLFPELSPASIERRLNKGGRFVYIKRHLTPQEQDGVLALGIPGLAFQADARRVYPQGAMMGHVLGYVDIDNHGLSGIEKTMDKRLRDPDLNHEPLALSIDLRVQHILREEMSKAIVEFQAIGAGGVVMDIATGEIVAMSSLPDFDPNIPGKMSDDAKFNRVSLGVYEMGSTFKTFTMAGALHYKTDSLTDGYDTTQAIHIGRFTIKDSHPENRWLSLPEIYAYSSNIGTVHTVMKIGPARQKAFLKSLGLLDPLTLEIPERGYPLYPRDWREASMMTIAFGHGMSVTPLHLVRAIGALVGDGSLPKLTLLANPSLRKKPVSVVGMDVVENMRLLMRLVVEYGTAGKANALGYDVGGKTGTAEKVKTGGYAHNDKMASFVGVFPINQPRYVVLVMMDEPRGNKSTYGFATGGWVAAPVVGRVIARMGPLLGMPPHMQPDMEANVPAWLSLARAKLAAEKN
jgi:cell division protein FtsI (penicillin-binding protein 3)